jgi:hypothetical protein
LVKSPFYAYPVDKEDATPRSLSSPASTESRIIDIKYQEANGRYDVTYHAQCLSNASILRTLANSAIMPPPHPEQYTPKVEMHSLDRILLAGNFGIIRP